MKAYLFTLDISAGVQVLFREILEVYLGKTSGHTEFNITDSNQQDSFIHDAFLTKGNTSTPGLS